MTEIEARTASVTASDVCADTPEYAADTTAAPFAMPIASPAEVIVARVSGVEAHAAAAVTSVFVPSV